MSVVKKTIFVQGGKIRITRVTDVLFKIQLLDKDNGVVHDWELMQMAQPGWSITLHPFDIHLQATADSLLSSRSPQ